MATVHTYYQPVPGMKYPARLLELWRNSWEKMGWETRMLTEIEARRHPGFQYFNDRVSKFPSVNPHGYDRACFLRHLAMAEIGGGLIVDYDVIPRREETPKIEEPWPPVPVILEPTRVPCAVMGNSDAFEQLCDTLCEHVVTEPHVSDMTIIRKTRLMALPTCVEHLCSGRPVDNDPGDGWKTAPMIHFSNYSFKKLGWTGDKADLIQRALAAI